MPRLSYLVGHEIRELILRQGYAGKDHQCEPQPSGASRLYDVACGILLCCEAIWENVLYLRRKFESHLFDLLITDARSYTKTA